ncbi:MAG: VWA domain-containing protein [bacterium]|nr:VWA domain-containing protein [bacterium]
MDSIAFTHGAYLPYVLAAAASILVICLLAVRRRNKILAMRGSYAGRVFRTWRLFLYACAISLVGLGIGVLLLGPHAKLTEPQTEYEPLDIVIARDLSLSMLAQASDDRCGPSRFTVARQEEKEFLRMIEERGVDRLGLVVFSRFGYRMVPVLTRDYVFFRRVSGTIDEELIPDLLGGTNHWDAALEATKIFKKESPHKRLLVIMTDGEPDGPPNILAERRVEALTALSELGKVSVYIIGIGDPAVSYPIPKTREKNGCPGELYVQTEGEEVGQIIFTKPDTVSLAMLASELGGTYRHSRTGSELAGMLHNIVTEERVPIGTKYVTRYQDLTKYVLWGTLGLLFISVLLKSP